MVRVVFVCLGNICRSPMADAVFKKMVVEAGLTSQIEVDSAGTAAYHVGSNPDMRTIECVQKHGIPIHHKARQFKIQDFELFDYIMVMDDENLGNVLKLGGTEGENVFKMQAFDDEKSNDDVPDPYYGGTDGFDHIYGLLNESCQNLLRYLVEKHSLTSD
ncbi:MAG: low molecular weight protein-tyrosine-phosphatase [Cyclobacteriaceae bacterium]